MADIRELKPEDYPEIIKITAEAYPEMGVLSAEDRERTRERFEFARRDTRWIPYGVYRDNRLVGVFRQFDFIVNVRNNCLPAGGLGMVAVDLAHKKERVAKEMVEFFHHHYDRPDCALTCLWPFRVDFYHQMGYGLGGRMHQYAVKPTDLPRGRTKEHVRFLTTDDIPAICDCQNRMFESRTGAIKSVAAVLEIKMKYMQDIRYIGCEIDGRLDGYFIYRFRRPKHPTNIMDHDMVVWEFVYHTPEALSELLTFLHTQVDQVDRVYLQTFDDEFYFLPANPTLPSGGRLYPTFHESNLSGVGTMYRVLDTARLFLQMADHDFGGVTLNLRIDIRDSFHSPNNRPVTVRFEQGHPSLLDNGKPDLEIGVDVAEFSSLMIGAVHFRTLFNYGLATISDPERLDEIDRLFYYPQKPVCISGF